MSGALKIDRARRNALKAGSLALGALLAASALPRQASAGNPGNNGNGNGGCGKGQQTNGCGDSGGNCFSMGTLVRTREGYRPVETLAAGDEVAVRFGGFAPIKAMVSHTLNRVAGKWAGNPNNLPVVIRQGALGENLPNADLCLTALHAVYVDGFLINAGDLVNGTSVYFKAADGHDSVEFFNIELEGHDILDVQGAFFESLHRAGMERCAPLLGFDGGRSKLRSHLRSVASLVVDRRQPIDIIRDNTEERGIAFARAA
jgi:hypothetical protein